jgi:hypothetical protein
VPPPGLELAPENTEAVDGQYTCESLIPPVAQIASQTYVMSDPDLSAIISAWPKLDPKIQKAIRTLAID